jgi:hypothetical protein
MSSIFSITGPWSTLPFTWEKEPQLWSFLPITFHVVIRKYARIASGSVFAYPYPINLKRLVFFEMYLG